MNSQPPNHPLNVTLFNGELWEGNPSAPHVVATASASFAPRGLLNL